jgi:hypothetical protein
MEGAVIPRDRWVLPGWDAVAAPVVGWAPVEAAAPVVGWAPVEAAAPVVEWVPAAVVRKAGSSSKVLAADNSRGLAKVAARKVPRTTTTWDRLLSEEAPAGINSRTSSNSNRNSSNSRSKCLLRLRPDSSGRRTGTGSQCHSRGIQ